MSCRTLRLAFLCLSICLLVAAGSAHAQASKLGTVEFPTSGTGKAQEHFLRGVAAMHSFWYEEALEEFRAATQADPGFAMGYWGEAMAHNHPIWQEQDTAAGRAALAKIGDTSKLTDRERAFIEAARVLYGQDEKPARDRAYLAAMEKVYSEYPDDLEVASFYSLALLGVHGYKVAGHQERMRAGAIALQVYAKNPNHPGAAHYIIHSFDDPEHAILALPAAFRYAEIAPAAHHARHMPSHIFIQLGMWPEAAASNEAAWQTSVDWVESKKLHPSLRDFHSLHWLHYIYLQQGRWARAEGLLELRRKGMDETASVGSAYRGRSDRLWSDMAAETVLETENWKRAFELFPESSPGAADAAGAGAHQHGGMPATGGRDQDSRNQVLAAYVRGMAAAHMGKPEADAARAQLEGLAEQARKRGDQELSESLLVMSGEVAAVHALKRGDTRKAIAAMEQAVKREEAMPAPSGPPELIKPSHEVFGEILLTAGDARRAREQFARSLERHPNRARSLVGAARAAAASGDAAGASDYYGKLLDVWRYADTQMAELKEARDYLQKHARTAGKDCAFCK